MYASMRITVSQFTVSYFGESPPASFWGFTLKKDGFGY